MSILSNNKNQNIFLEGGGFPGWLFREKNWYGTKEGGYRFVFGNFDRFSSVTSMINELGWSSLLERRDWAKWKVIFKAYKGF